MLSQLSYFPTNGNTVEKNFYAKKDGLSSPSPAQGRSRLQHNFLSNSQRITELRHAMAVGMARAYVFPPGLA